MLTNAFHSKTVLITGHTGFKGAWLTAWLNHLGARVVGIALDPPTDPSHYSAANLSHGIKDHRIDILHRQKLQSIILDEQPDFLFHLAAQSLVRNSYLDPIQTWETNVLGTLHILEALRSLRKSCSAVIITKIGRASCRERV